MPTTTHPSASVAPVPTPAEQVPDTASAAPTENSREPRQARGEMYVWLSAMGLCIGLLMVAGLMWLIFSQGLAVFWPKQAVVLHLKPGSKAGIAGAETLGGEIAKQQEKTTRDVAQAANDKSSHQEWQLFVGNRDVYGFSFIYLDYDQVESVAHPADLMKIERLEYGKAFGQPVGLLTKDNPTPLAVSDPAFEKQLAAAVEEGNQRRHQIEHIEKGEIGEINRHMERLAQQGRNVALESAEGKQIAGETATLQAQYDKLAAQAQTLRSRQDDHMLQVRLPDSRELSISTGNIVSYYYPNRLGFFGKLGLFFKQIARFVSEDPREANTEGGIFPAIYGTFVMTLLMSMAVTPFGVIAAIYLREYAVQGFFVRAVRIAVNNLAGVPSIVFGVFGLGFFVYFLGGTLDAIFFKSTLPTPTFGTGGILWAALTLALMTVPVVIVATEEALAAVPRGVREGALACGASKWQTIQNVVLPASSAGILTGLILAMARGAGEVAPLMLVGVVKLAPSLPLDGVAPFIHLDQKFMHLGFHIYDLGFQSPDSEAAKPMVFATTLFLILLVVLLNLGAIFIRERLRRRFATGAF